MSHPLFTCLAQSSVLFCAIISLASFNSFIAISIFAASASFVVSDSTLAISSSVQVILPIPTAPPGPLGLAWAKARLLPPINATAVSDISIVLFMESSCFLITPGPFGHPDDL